ncbi:MAG: DUF4401 domain-containing protein [Methyloligellaceae bacterium]
MTDQNSLPAAEHETPIYMHLLIAFGMVVASSFFIGLIYSLKIFSSSNNHQHLILGGILIIGSVAMLYTGKKGPLAHNAFFIICALSLWVAGITFYLIGLEPNSVFRVALYFTLISLPIYLITQQKLLGFLTILALFVLLNISCYFDRHDNDIGGMGLQIMFILQILGVGVFLCFPKIEKEYEPIFYGLIASLCVGSFYLVYAVTFSAFTYSKPAVYAVNVVSIAMSAGLIALIIWAFGGFHKKYAEPMIIAIAGVMVLTTRLDPGIVLAISLLILGYKRQEGRISIIGMILLPVVIVFYYYSLNITLFEKSMHLLAGGGLLLAGCGYMKLRGWVEPGKATGTA